MDNDDNLSAEQADTDPTPLTVIQSIVLDSEGRTGQDPRRICEVQPTRRKGSPSFFLVPDISDRISIHIIIHMSNRLLLKTECDFVHLAE